MPITNDDVHAWLQAFAARVKEEKSYLTRLDSAIGDGDHGQNLNRGLQAALDRVGNEDDIATTFRNTAMALISKTGGASGPLYGTFFMDAGKAAPDNDTLTLHDWAEMMRAGLGGVVRRGKAETGEKTMLDSITPAVESLEQAAQAERDLREALLAAATAAEEGMKATIPMIATKGRASYLGERSKGHQDPGATSSYYLFEAAAKTLGNG